MQGQFTIVKGLNMIKVQNNTASREALPTFLLGLELSSLQDLSWTDPALGVQDFAWYPEDNQSLPLGEFEEYGEETLTIDTERKVVVSSKEVVAMSAEKIAEIETNKAAAKQAYKESLATQITTLQTELESLND
jgi:hypothetical protein